MERLTDEIEESREYIRKIDDMGGRATIENNFIQREIRKALTISKKEKAKKDW